MPLRWILIVWMFVMSAIAYLDRVNISIALSSIRDEFGFTDVQMGPILSAFIIGYALFQIPGGRLADRFGPRLVITLGVVWWGIFTAATALLPVGWPAALMMMIAIRFILGVGEAVVYPSSNRLVAAWIPSRERGVANGLIFAGVGFGAGITPPLITYLLINYGWRWSFYFCAILGLAAGAVWHILARNTPQEHPWISKAEEKTIEEGLPQASAMKSHVTLPLRKVFASKDVLAITVSYFVFGYVAWVFFTWFFNYLNEVRGLDLKSSAWYAMLPFMAMAVFSVVGGIIADRLTKAYGARIGRCGISVVGIGLAAIFIALATQVESAQWAAIVLAGGAGALYLSQSSYWAVTADVAGPAAGTVSGLMNMGGQIGGAVTASLTPIIAQAWGWTASFLVVAGLCVIGSLAWLVVDPNARLSTD